MASGACPGCVGAPVNILEERTVGPSLGSDSIRQGIIATLIGTLFVIIFMILYYRFPGCRRRPCPYHQHIPGARRPGCVSGRSGCVAGHCRRSLLTVGVAVDANILIFERIREELRTGKTIRLSLETGYNRAFITIIDTHITGIVAAVFLIMFGTGPIKGFAVTTIIGLLASLFTAVFVTRVIFDYVILEL